MSNILTKCSLCKANEADQTGSHIVPSFLLKRIENIDGRTGRDYEIGFTLTDQKIESHFGREVPIEKLNEVYGELTDDEIKANKHPLVVDFIFCRSCEIKLGVVESEYASRFNSEEENINSAISFLFWSSIIWRLSINRKDSNHLTKSHSEILRRILDRTLKDNLSAINQDELLASNDKTKISYKLLRAKDFSNEHPTFLSFVKGYNNPYLLILDEYICLFRFGNKTVDSIQKDYFGLKDKLRNASYNNYNELEVITSIREEEMSNMIKFLLAEYSKLRTKNINIILDKVHRYIDGKGRFMPLEIKKEIVINLYDNEKELGRRFSNEEFIEVVISVLRKYIPFQN